MWRDKGRSGIGDAFIGQDSDGAFSEGHTYEGWDNLSPNGRQWKSPLTDEVRDLSGANYWHLRKENFPTTVCETITAESYSTPPYYHKKHDPVHTPIDVAKDAPEASQSATGVPVKGSPANRSSSFWQEVLKNCDDGNVFKKWFYKP